MERDRFERAKARLERAWNEAQYLYDRRSGTDKTNLYLDGQLLLNASQSLGEVFDQLEDHPCATCKRCCTQAAFSVGFHSHTERQVILEEITAPGSQFDHPLDLVVEHWEGEPPDRCLFLTRDGCNLPSALRSGQCSTYACRDKLGVALVSQGLEPEYKKARGKRSAALRVLQDSLADLDFELNVDSLGDG